MPVDPFSLLAGGDLAGAILAPFTNLFTVAGVNYFYLIVTAIGLMMIYIKTQDYIVTAVTGALVSVVMIAVLPGQIQVILYILLGVAITIVVYGLIFRRSE